MSRDGEKTRACSQSPWKQWALLIRPIPLSSVNSPRQHGAYHCCCERGETQGGWSSTEGDSSTCQSECLTPPLLILSWLCEPAHIRCFLSRSRLLQAPADPPLPPALARAALQSRAHACGFATCNWIEALRLCCPLPVNWREYKCDTHVHTCSKYKR